jgi:hypothetical protein
MGKNSRMSDTENRCTVHLLHTSDGIPHGMSGGGPVTQQQASLTLAVPLPEIERILRDVTGWDHFLVGVKSVVKTSHERYRFRLADGREIPVAVHFHPQAHRFTWHTLSGPPFDGVLHLAEAGPTHTRVTLHLTTRPAGTMANLLEMLATSTSRAAVDLLWLDNYVHVHPRSA